MSCHVKSPSWTFYVLITPSEDTQERSNYGVTMGHSGSVVNGERAALDHPPRSPTCGGSEGEAMSYISTYLAGGEFPTVDVDSLAVPSCSML